MRQDVQDLITAMQAGWKKVPAMSEWYFEDRHGHWRGHFQDITEIRAACAQGHALLGKNALGIGDWLSLFPILKSQRVLFKDGTTTDLGDAINRLVMDAYWTTPQVIEWLRSHLND